MGFNNRTENEMIEFNHPEKGWVEAYAIFPWEDYQRINEICGREIYRLKEDSE